MQPFNVMLNIFGSPCSYGMYPQGKLSDTRRLLDHAEAFGLTGVEVPMAMVEWENPASWKALGKDAAQRKLRLVLAIEGTETEFLLKALEAADSMGARVLRTVVGGAGFGGNRRAYALGEWQSFMYEVTQRVAGALDKAEGYGIPIAIEDHQDVDSDDLVALCETLGSDYIGVTLDTANALGVAEHPIAFAEKVAPYVKHVHLKDYKIYRSESGYRLVRCPVGQGVVPFTEIIPILQAQGHCEWASLEIGATEARHVECLDAEFWPEYPNRPAAEFAHALRFVLDNAQPWGEDFRTPHEKGASLEERVAYEQAQLADSIEFLSQWSRTPLKAQAVASEATP